MPIPSVTNHLAAEVERLSGRPVIVQEDRSLPVFANMVTARGSAPAHVVRYRPGPGMPTDYFIAFQLTLVVRLFSCPPDERWQVAADEMELRRARADFGLDGLSPMLAGFLMDSLITQVRTTGVGMRVDRWLRAEFPELQAQQEQAARMQLAENEQSLAPEVRRRFPPPLVDANTGMNAAFARFWSLKLGEKRFEMPYEALGYDQTAQALLGTLKEVSHAPGSDRQLIEAWARIVGLTGYFHFEPHVLL